MRRLSDVDWSDWRAVDTATLVFVVRDGHVLLIRKKRGLGAGKINGPGGRLDPGETPEVCAVREIEEELLVTPLDPVHLGEHRFQFVDGYSIHVHIFLSSGIRGEPQETEEAIPIWCPVDDLPFDEMWEDDRLWLPHALAGRRLNGRFIFDGDRMLDHALELLADQASAP